MDSFGNIAHIFGGKDYDAILRSLGADEVSSIVAKLRNDLILSGKKCSVYRHLIAELKKMDDYDDSYIPSSDIDRRWVNLANSHSGVYEMLGFAMILKMDAESMLIGMLTAESDTERIVVSKHAYTIVAEARNNDLFSVLARRMKDYPDVILPKEDYDDLWGKNRKLVRGMTSSILSNRVRNFIDAHRHSFSEQLDTYMSVDWIGSLKDMLIIVEVVDNVVECMEKVHNRFITAYNEFEIDARAYMARLDAIIKQFNR